MGNHDFDQGGLPNLFQKKQDFAPNLSLLCANVYKNGKEILQPYKIFERNGIRIAVIALLGEDAWNVVSVTDKSELTRRHINDVSREIIDSIKKKESPVDYFIALSHTGVNRGDSELAATGLYNCIFAAHEHFRDLAYWTSVPHVDDPRISTLLHPGNCEGTAVSKLEIFKNDDGLINTHTDTVLLDESFDGLGSEEAKKIDLLLREYALKIEDIAGEELGYCHSENYSREFLAKTIQSSVSALAPLSHIVLDSIFHVYGLSSQPPTEHIPSEKLVAMINFGSLRGQLPQGKISVGSVFNCFPYNSQIDIIKVKGIHLRKLHERNLKRVLDPAYFAIQTAHGLGIHVKWMVDREADLLLPSDCEDDETFYLMTSKYLRENDLKDILPGEVEINEFLDHLVVWSSAAHLNSSTSCRGIRDGLIEIIRARKVLH